MADSGKINYHFNIEYIQGDPLCFIFQLKKITIANIFKRWNDNGVPWRTNAITPHVTTEQELPSWLQ